MNLEQLAELVTTFVRDRNIPAEVVGVMPGEGEGCYTEVILAVHDGANDRRVALGVSRAADPDELRTRISDQLKANLGRVVS